MATATRPTSRCRRSSPRSAKPPDSVFSVERVIYPLINEAVLALQEHVASVNDVDMAMIAGTGMTYHGERKGPLAIADEIGLDVVLAGLEQFFAQYGERFRPARLLRTKVRAGHLGTKVGAGSMSMRKGLRDRIRDGIRVASAP